MEKGDRKMTDIEKKMLQEIVDLSDEEKLSLIADSYTNLFPVLTQIDKENHGLALLTAILASAVNADGKMNVSELAVVASVLSTLNIEVPLEDIVKLMSIHRNSQNYDMIHALAKALPNELRSHLITLVMAISAIDDTIDKSEVAYILDLIHD